MDNLKIWNSVRAVPDTAQKPITGGRLNGKTDINPMWRLKVLTENFGMCGAGWKYEVVKTEIIEGAKNEKAAFVQINLFVKVDEKWSDAIPGTGGSMLIESEKAGLHTNNECFKMAMTDAISVSCKALGVGADVYWDKDTSKYDKTKQEPKQEPINQGKSPLLALQMKSIQKATIARLKSEDLALQCLNDLKAKYKVGKMSELLQEGIKDYLDFIGKWQDSDLPFTVAPEVDS